jgi:2-dehydropantoate 2-reductase
MTIIFIILSLSNLVKAFSFSTHSPTFHRRPTALRVTDDPQNIVVIGSGAVGSYYGARLWEAGHNVTFLFRPGPNYEAVKQQGSLMVGSVYGDIQVPASEIRLHETQQSQSSDIDWVIVAFKSTSLESIPSLLLPWLNPTRTRVLVIMNGLIEDDLIDLLKKETGQQDNGPLQCLKTLFGGMALVCSNRIKPATVYHSYAGALSAGIASTIADHSDEGKAFQELFHHVPAIDTTFEDSLLRGRWKKMVWNLPFNGISVAMGGITIDKVVQDPGLRQLAEKIMNETNAIANADLESRGETFEPLGESEKKQMMTLSDGMGPYKTSTMLDFVNRRSMEVKYIFRKPAERAKALGIPAPYLETIVSQIEAFQRMYNLY